MADLRLFVPTCGSRLCSELSQITDKLSYTVTHLGIGDSAGIRTQIPVGMILSQGTVGCVVGVQMLRSFLLVPFIQGFSYYF